MYLIGFLLFITLHADYVVFQGLVLSHKLILKTLLFSVSKLALHVSTVNGYHQMMYTNESEISIL